MTDAERIRDLEELNRTNEGIIARERAAIQELAKRLKEVQDVAGARKELLLQVAKERNDARKQLKDVWYAKEIYGPPITIGENDDGRKVRAVDADILQPGQAYLVRNRSDQPVSIYVAREDVCIALEIETAHTKLAACRRLLEVEQAALKALLLAQEISDDDNRRLNEIDAALAI